MDALNRIVGRSSSRNQSEDLGIGWKVLSAVAATAVILEIASLILNGWRVAPAITDRKSVV